MADRTENTKKIDVSKTKKKTQIELHPRMFPESRVLAKFIKETRDNIAIRKYIAALLEAKSEGYNCELCEKKIKTPYCPKCKKPSGTSSKHDKWRKKRNLKEESGEVICDRCAGTGHLSKGDCPKCEGKGKLPGVTDISATGVGSFLQKWLIKHKDSK